MPRRWPLLLFLFLLAACSDDPLDPSEHSFAGHWDFELTISGSACPGDASGQDCFAIHQVGADVFIVDDAKGNLTGRVMDGVATIARATAQESVYLELRMLAGGQRVEGFAIEADSTRGCTTELLVVGSRRAGRCN